MADRTHDRAQCPPNPAPPSRRSGEKEEELVLCVGGPPTVRNLLSLGSARVVVLDDLESLWSFVAEQRVSRILVDLRAVANPSQCSPGV